MMIDVRLMYAAMKMWFLYINILKGKVNGLTYEWSKNYGTHQDGIEWSEERNAHNTESSDDETNIVDE